MKKNLFNTTIVAAITLCIALLCGYNLNAAFLQNVPQTIVQPDGTTIECFTTGDEFYNWLHDSESYTIIKNTATGFYVYADKVADELVPTNLIVGRDNPETLGLQRRLIISNEKYMEIRKPFDELQKASFLERESRAAKSDAQLQNPKRTINSIVIFVEFANATFSKTDLTAYEKDYNTNDLSMRAYFEEISYGNLTVNTHFFPHSSNGKILPFKSHRNRGYLMPKTTQNPDGYNPNSMAEQNIRKATIIAEAIQAVSSQIPANLNVDSDNDGRIDAITIIYQGNASNNSILWPLKWSIWPQHASIVANAKINGKNVFDFNTLLENFSDMGVAAHEFFHILGAPDLYTNNDNIDPVAYWDVMSHGSYSLPAIPHPAMHLKQKYGKWIPSIPVITKSGYYTLNPVTAATNNAFRINAQNSNNEYFVLEYRRHIAGKFGASTKNMYPQNNGLLITRIIPTSHGNLNTKAYEVYAYRPNGTLTSNGIISQAAFSDEYSRTAMNATTNPSPFLSNGTQGGLNIKEIKRVDSTITFYITLPGDTLEQFDVVLKTSPILVGNVQGAGKYKKDSLATISATVLDNCYRFKNWTNNQGGVVSTNNPFTFSVKSDTTLTANFELIQYDIQTNATAGGTVVGAGKFNCGANVTLTALANSGYQFTNWTRKGTNTVISSNNPYNFTVNGNDSLVANFAVIQTQTYTITVTASRGGRVTSNPSNLANLAAGTNVTLTAIPNNAAFQFVSWTRQGTNTVVSTNNPYTFAVNSADSLVANFMTGGAIQPAFNPLGTGVVSILPNPAQSDFTVSFDVLQSGDMRLILQDLSGSDILHIFDGYVSGGIFSRTVATNNLARGVYFLNILIDGNSTVTKVILE